MKESIYKNYDELPLFLNAATVAKVLGMQNRLRCVSRALPAASQLST